ncbi:hypothetical protein NKI20_02235 [Mesorhizobium sp. M0830]|uniref:hypothetical protein n=1 Tax=Mesorhizobium sp. M0830 TaxID=2957008 RepID=UPI00333DC607
MWAIFNDRFHYDRRPRQAIAFVVEAKPEPQNYPRDLVEAAVAAGKAQETKPPGKRLKATETSKSNGRL